MTQRTQRRTKRNATTNFGAGMPEGGFPKQQVVKLKYVTEQAITVNTGLSKSVNFCANGMYDPELAVGGHQPKMFDQWMAVYSHYNVLSSKVTVRLASSVSANLCWGVSRTPTTDQLTGKTLPYILENRYQGDWTLNGSADVGPETTTPQNRTMHADYSQKSEFGPNSEGRDDLNGSAIINPHEQSIFELWACPVGGSTSTINALFIVEIEYLALLTEPKIVSQS